jgi:hypothetical protein
MKQIYFVIASTDATEQVASFAREKCGGQAMIVFYPSHFDRIIKKKEKRVYSNMAHTIATACNTIALPLGDNFGHTTFMAKYAVSLWRYLQQLSEAGIQTAWVIIPDSAKEYINTGSEHLDSRTMIGTIFGPRSVPGDITLLDMETYSAQRQMLPEEQVDMIKTPTPVSQSNIPTLSVEESSTPIPEAVPIKDSLKESTPKNGRVLKRPRIMGHRKDRSATT